MGQDQWSAVDQYFAGLLAPEDAALRSAIEASRAAGLPEQQVSPTQGMLLHLLARLRGARTMLEIGTLGAYSTIWLARALPSGGRLITLEANPAHAEVAARNIANAGLSDRVAIRVGPALETLPLLAREHIGPFDLIFIDADKPNNPKYLEWALILSRPGTLLIFDNVVRDGAVADPASADPNVAGVRATIESLGEDKRLRATAIQTVGVKGYDGFALALVAEE